jgi:hypothetical protein
MPRHFPSFFAVSCVSFLAVGSAAVVGCSKQPEPSASATAQKPAAEHGTAAAAPAPASKGPGQVAWTDPAGWKREPPANAMRVAQYTLAAAAGDAEPAECIVTTFGPGQGGSTEQNLDRWIRQFAADDKTTLEKGSRTVSDLKVSTLEMSGTFRGMGDGGGKPGTRMLAAVVEAPSGLWFFKLTGPDATVKAAKPGFDALLGSLTTTK